MLRVTNPVVVGNLFNLLPQQLFEQGVWKSCANHDRVTVLSYKLFDGLKRDFFTKFQSLRAIIDKYWILSTHLLLRSCFVLCYISYNFFSIKRAAVVRVGAISCDRWGEVLNSTLEW